MDVIFSTERLVVRAWTDSDRDVDRIFDIYSRWEVARWLGAEPKVLESREQARGTVERWAARTDAEGRFGIWAVEVRHTGVVAGTVLLVPLPATATAVARTDREPGDATKHGEAAAEEEVEVGWHFHPDSWGHGYATEAARGALALGFAAGLAEIHAVVRPGNEPSMAVCRRLGMTALGLTNRWYGLELEAFRATA